jgi:outer membrane protein assembly factor BamB
MCPKTHPLFLGRKTGGIVKKNALPAGLGLALLAAALPAAGADWPGFRGPWSNGHVQAPGDTQPAGLPLHWSETENVKWKTPVPDRGWSTPAVLGGQVWLTTATGDGHDFFVLCVDADAGKILCNEKLFHCDTPESLGAAAAGNPMNSYATPSPVIEPGRVYVSFGSYGTACLDTATQKVLWQRQDLPCSHYRGPSSSPVLFDNLLILTMDGADLQYTVALDKSDGHTVWKTDRTSWWTDHAAPGQNLKEGDMHKAHSTPVIVTTSGKTMLLSADANAATAYNPRTGKEIWKIHNTDFSPAPLPVFDGDLAFFVSGMSRTELVAVKTDGQGDVTDTHVVWKQRAHIGKFSSPIVVDDLLYMAAAESIISCFETASGQVVWTERIPGNYQASPVYADGRIYFFNQEGVTTVLKPGRACEVLATNTLAGGFMASPAVAGRAFFLRTKTHLYRIESTGSEAR